MSSPITVVEKGTEHEHGSAYESCSIREIQDRISDLGGAIKGLGNLMMGYELLHTISRDKSQRTIACERTLPHSPKYTTLQKSSVNLANSTNYNSISSYAPPKRHTPIPTLRGGAATPPSPSYTSLATELDRIYSQLLSNTSHQLSSERTQAWSSVAGILQLRNAYLETQLAEYEEMYASALQDIKWNVDMCARLEDRLEAYEEEERAEVERECLKRTMKQGKQEEDDEKDQKEDANNSPLSSHTSNPGKEAVENHVHPFFIFYPSRSLILIPGLPAQTLRFATGTTLQQIHDLLTQSHNNNNDDFLEISPTALIVRDILAARESMGIMLPDSLRDEVVCIRVPERCAGIDGDVRIAAWETVKEEGDEEDVVIEEDAGDDNWGSHCEQYFNDCEWSGEGSIEEEGMSVCSCTACAEEMEAGNKGPVGISVCKEGKDHEDDRSDEECCGCNSDSDDAKEVQHDDEARTPWGKRKSPKKHCAIHFRGEMVQPRWDSVPFLNHCPPYTTSRVDITHHRISPEL
jgi:hypothetical protein